jgi:hypothetical protein
MRSRLIAGIVMCLAGAVWFFQGIGTIQSDSFMTDEPIWSVIGAFVFVIGVIFIRASRKFRTPS